MCMCVDVCVRGDLMYACVVGPNIEKTVRGMWYPISFSCCLQV